MVRRGFGRHGREYGERRVDTEAAVRGLREAKSFAARE
jgi:hypothetical protein